MTNSGIYAGDRVCYVFTDFSPTLSYLGLKPIYGLILQPPGINAGVIQNLKITQTLKPGDSKSLLYYTRVLTLMKFYQPTTSDFKQII